MSARVFSHEPINFRSMPPGTLGVIVACAAVFVLGNIVGDRERFYELFGLVPRSVVYERWLWQPFTYLFVHGGLMHLLFNLFAFWMFGMPVESQWGEREFMKYFFLCGLGGAAAQVALNPHSAAPVLGASGAVYGMLVAFAMLYPDAVIYMYFLIPIKASHFAILFGAIEFFAGAHGGASGVARFAHLGGMVTGYLYIRWWWVLKIKGNSWWKELTERGPGPRPRMELRSRERESEMAEIDRILDKILVSGIESLTEEEREIMKRYSQQKN